MVALSDPVLAQVAERLSSHDVSELRPLSGGASSLTYVGRHAGRRVVVKVAPPGVAPTAHRDVLRQARIIKALGATPVPVPEILFEDAGDPPLFAMSLLDGISCEPLFDDADAGPELIVGERFRNAARAMAELHRVGPDTVGLSADTATRPVDEVERWCRTLETVDPGLVSGWRDVADTLRASAPPALQSAIVHGDFRLGNLLADGSRITGIVDWEIWSVGDPRVDAGWFLVNCDPGTYCRPTRYAAAAPSLDELASIYADAVGYEVPQLDWFRALACFKSTATWSLIVKHNRRREMPDPDLEAMAPVLPRLLSRAGQLLG